MPYSIEAVTNERELSGLRGDWNQLSKISAQPNVFMTYDWFRIWNQCLTQKELGDRRPNVLVVRKNGCIVGLTPLVYRTASRFGVAVRKLEFADSFADYHDLALGNDPEGSTRAIAEYLAGTRDQWDVVELRDLRDSGDIRRLIENALSHNGLVYRLAPERERCPYLPIDGPSLAIVSRLSGTDDRSTDGLRTFRKKQHRLERLKAEGLTLRIIENPEEERGLLDKLILLERQKRVDGELSPPFISEYPQIFQSLFDTLGPRGWFSIGLMEMGERPIGSRLVFRCGKKLWDFLTAYDHDFSRLSPGNMLVSALIDYGYAHGYDEFDFLRGEEWYKKQWSTHMHQSYRLLVWSPRWASRTRAFVYLDLKRLVYSLIGKGE